MVRGTYRQQVATGRRRTELPRGNLAPSFRHWLGPLAFCLCGVCVIPLVAAAQDDAAAPLTMDDAVRLALASHPTVSAAHARVQAARHRLRSASALPNPELAWNPFWGSQNVGGGDEELIVGQPIDIGGRRRLATRVAAAHLSGARAEAELAHQELALEVRTAYIELLLARDIVALNQSLVDTATRFRDAAQRRFDVGDVPRIEVDRAGLELARAEQELLQSESETHVREAALDELMGWDVGTPIALADSLEFRPTPVSDKDLAELALRQRPELQAAEDELRARRRQVDVEAAERRPGLVVEGRRNDLGSDGRNAVLLAFTLPLLDLGAIHNGVRAARSDVAEQEGICRELRREIRLDVATAVEHLRQARALAERYGDDIVPATQRVTQTIGRGFDAGASTILDVLDAQRTLRSVETEYRRAVAAYLEALAGLDRATGAPAPAQD